MNRNQAIEQLKAHADAIRGLGAQSLYLFGSTGRGEARADSDVDLFIDYDEASDFSLFDLLTLQSYLEDILQARADVLTRSSLHPVLKDDIEAEAIRVF